MSLQFESKVRSAEPDNPMHIVRQRSAEQERLPSTDQFESKIRSARTESWR